jgi:hypothetical protein
MAVTFGAKSVDIVEQGSGTTLNLTTLTVGSEADRVLLVQIAWSATDPGTVTVTWDYGGANQVCELIKYEPNGSGRKASLYGLVNPVAGNKTLRVAVTNTTGWLLGACYFYNADQTGGTTTFRNANSATGSSTAPSVVITSATGEATCSVMDAPSGTGTTNQTLLWFISGGGGEDGGADYAAGAASVTHTWTIEYIAGWAIVGCSIKAAGGAVDSNFIFSRW